jgi:putative oxidoreductase
MARFIARTRRNALASLHKLDWLPPLLARVTLGILFIGSGWGKLQNLGKVTAFFTTLGIPLPAFNAGLVAWVELIGGALLLIGLLSRLAALPLIVTMVVALLTAKASEIHGLSDLFFQIEWAYVVLLVWIAIDGPGRVSLDYWLRARRGTSKHEPFVDAEARA